MDSDQTAIFISAIAVMISQGQTVETLELLATILDQLSVTISTIAIRRANESEKITDETILTI